MKTYSGMFVGGPKNGEFLRHEAPFVRVPVWTERELKVSSVEEVTKQPVIDVKYFDHMVGLMGEFEIDFWVDKSEFKSVGAVLNHVFVTYIDAVGKEKERE